MIKEIKVINYSYKNNEKQLLIPKKASANGTLDPCKTPPCCYLQLQFQFQCNAVDKHLLKMSQRLIYLYLTTQPC